MHSELDLIRSDKVLRHRISQARLLQALTPYRSIGRSAEISDSVANDNYHENQNFCCEFLSIDSEVRVEKLRYNNISCLLAVLENIATIPHKVQNRRSGLHAFIHRSNLSVTRAA